MQRRIYRNFLLLVFLSTLVLTVALCTYFYDGLKRQAFADVRQSTEQAVALLDSRSTDLASTDALEAWLPEVFEFVGDDINALRITVIAPDGRVLFDNQIVAGSLGNHSDRSEVIAALTTGSGQASRFSDTRLAETYYYAIRLEDGNVLRMAKTLNSVASMVWAMLPVVVMVLVSVLFLANFLARRLTRNIIQPLDHIDFEQPNTAVYDELVPYAKRIDQQRLEIRSQMAELHSSSETIKAITENMREGLIQINSQGQVLTANASARAIFRDDDILGNSILHVCRDIDFQHGVSECLAGKPAERVWAHSDRLYNVYFSPVPSGESGEGGVILFFDITERQAAEQQRREFTANVSHELKTPLTSISALSELIGTGMADAADIPDFARRITAQAKQMIAIIDDIIKLSEFDEQQASREFALLDIGELVNTTVAALRAQADEKDIGIEIGGGNLLVPANRQMLEELLTNLIDNAIKYSEAGDTITVSHSQADGYCRLTIADTGIGIAAEHQSRVFERFYRVDPSRSKKTGGTGLGLSIVKHIVEYHGGRIELDSSIGFGTTITCWLPLADMQNPELADPV